MYVVEPARAAALVKRFAGRRVLVVGDVMLDHFVYGRVERISPEAPVPVVAFEHEEHRPGGAANVAHNLASLGATVELVGVVGADVEGTRLRDSLVSQRIACSGLLDVVDRPTTRKMRIVTTRNQQVARIDFEADCDVTGETEARLLSAALERLDACEIVVVSDYMKGTATPGLMAGLVRETRPRGLRLLVDPKIPHIDRYRGASLVTPNHHEAETATAMRIRSDAEAREAARRFQARVGCESVLITRGERGMWLLEGRWAASPGAVQGSAPGAPADIVAELGLPAVAREVADVTGAGDTVIAATALALAAGAALAEAAEIANHAAGVSVAKFGPAAVAPDELLASFPPGR